jgi:hypothetical protein
MKSKELIRLLQEEDPTGEVEVCVQNVDIHCLTTEPAYWDGSLQVLSRDKSKEPYYNITGGKYVRSGSKIVIHPLSIRDVIFWHPDEAVVDYSDFNTHSVERVKEADEKTRQAGRDLEKKSEMDGFFAWAKKAAVSVNPELPDMEELRDVTDYFFEQNLSPNEPLKELPAKPDKDGYLWHPSIVERRESGWNDRFEVRWTGYWGIHKK